MCEGDIGHRGVNVYRAARQFERWLPGTTRALDPEIDRERQKQLDAQVSKYDPNKYRLVATIIYTENGVAIERPDGTRTVHESNTPKITPNNP